MYSNASLYYLNQMGIRPWIMRVAPARPESSVKLLVFIPENLSDKAQNLLQQIIASTHLAPNELELVRVQRNDSIVLSIKQHAQAKTIFFLDLSELPNEASSFNLEAILKQPSSKRKIFHELRSLLT